MDPSIGALHYFSGLQQGLGDETKKGRLGSGKGDGVRWVSLVRSQAIPPPRCLCRPGRVAVTQGPLLSKSRVFCSFRLMGRLDCWLSIIRLKSVRAPSAPPIWQSEERWATGQIPLEQKQLFFPLFPLRFAPGTAGEGAHHSLAELSVCREGGLSRRQLSPRVRVRCCWGVGGAGGAAAGSGEHQESRATGEGRRRR